MAGLRNALRAIAAERDDWAGIPMPMTGCPMVIEPNYPKAAEIMAIGAEPEEEHPPGIKVRNTFWSWHRRSEVIVWEEGGKIRWGPGSYPSQIMLQLQTLNVSDAWGIEQEGHAVQVLGELLRHRQFKQYLLTGMFLEQSRRSGVHYIFRRLRPTIAFRATERGSRVLCALCLHPIGYYSRSWSGAMCPTDEVVAHLMLMRGDEPMLWRRANQHPAWRPEAGL